MHQHHQADIQDFSGQTGHPKISADMVLQNGQFCPWQTRQIADCLNTAT